MAKKPRVRRVKRALSPYNRHVQREMKAGRSMKQAAASWKSGSKRTSVRRISVPRRRARSRAVAKTGGRKTMGKSGFNTQKIMKYLRLAALAGPGAHAVLTYGANKDGLTHALLRYTGFDMRTGQFNGAALASGWMPYLASVGVTYGVPKLAGIIRGL